MECYHVKIGGYRNHVHILCLLSKKIALMKLLGKVKSHSSQLVKTKDECMKFFYWQNGYGAFSVNLAQVNRVKAYIENQYIHHGKKIFKEEYLEFLNVYNIEYDERYLWD